MLHFPLVLNKTESAVVLSISEGSVIPDYFINITIDIYHIPIQVTLLEGIPPAHLSVGGKNVMNVTTECDQLRTCDGKKGNVIPSKLLCFRAV